MPHRGGPHKVGNRAFARLAEALQLQGTVHVGSVDVHAAIPTIALERYVEAERVELRAFLKNVAHAGADNTVFDLQPHVAGDWDELALGPRQVSEGVRAEYDAWVTNVGVKVNSGASNLTASSIYLQNTTGPSLNGTTLLASGTSVRNSLIIEDGEPFIVTPLPWLQPRPAASPWKITGRLQSGGAIDISVYLTVLAASPGILPRFW